MLRGLAPWTRERDLIPRGDDPVLTLNREMARLFDRLARSGYDLVYPAYAYGSGTPTVRPMVEIDETDAAYKVSAELPGVDEKDIEVLLYDDGTLTIRGEKHVDHEGAAFSERTYGRFERMIALGAAVDAARNGCKATFKNGVLTVFVPKAAEASTARRIRVNEEAQAAAPHQAPGAEAQAAPPLREAA